MRTKQEIMMEVAKIESEPEYVDRGIDQGENEYLFLEVLVDIRDELAKISKCVGPFGKFLVRDMERNK